MSTRLFIPVFPLSLQSFDSRLPLFNITKVMRSYLTGALNIASGWRVLCHLCLTRQSHRHYESTVGVTEIQMGMLGSFSNQIFPYSNWVSLEFTLKTIVCFRYLFGIIPALQSSLLSFVLFCVFLAYFFYFQYIYTTNYIQEL